MTYILTSPYTLLLALTLITIYYYEKSEKLKSITLPFSLSDGMTVSSRAITIPMKTNAKAVIYYEINGIKKSTIADHMGHASIYHYFDTDKLNLKIYTDKYQNIIKEVTIIQNLESEDDLIPTKVFDEPYRHIAATTDLRFHVEDDYILVNIKSDNPKSKERDEFVAYLLEEAKYKIDLMKEENDTYNILYMVNNQLINI